MITSVLGAQEKPAGKQAESWAAELKSRELQTVDVTTAIGVRPKPVWHVLCQLSRQHVYYQQPSYVLSKGLPICAGV